MTVVSKLYKKFIFQQCCGKNLIINHQKQTGNNNTFKNHKMAINFRLPQKLWLARNVILAVYILKKNMIGDKGYSFSCQNIQISLQYKNTTSE